ncbi:MAG: sulfotransferase domain-containing protein [Desulfuromusa sp.]|nr:sulfotransferase domain-containing protein [Desulfuromusa sp.]
MLPGFIIIGAMKGGTSSLYRYIASHPEVVPSSTKETDFFKTVDDFNKGLDWYKSLFRKNGELAFEASPNYTKRHLFPGVPARMHSILPETKLIYVLRDPIDRVVSHYVHNYAHGRESRLLSEVIRSPDSNYIQTSNYYFQIQGFLEYYSDKKLLLIESERLRKDTVNVVNDVFKFLNLSPEHDTSILEKNFHLSSEKKRKSSLERALETRTTNQYLRSGIRLITAPLRKSIERPKLSSVDSTILAEALAPDVEKLRRFSGLEFSSWSL